MSKFLLILAFSLASMLSAQANNCLIKVDADLKDNSTITQKLAAKGYTVSESEDAEYNLSLYYGNAMTMTDCYIYSAYLKVENSGKQMIAEAVSETSFLRELLNRRSIPKAMTKKAFKKLLKNLPTCEVLPE